MCGNGETISDTRKPQTLTVTVVEVTGRCPVYEVGDSFQIRDGFRLETKRALCMHSLASLLPYYVALSRGVSPVRVGLARQGPIAYLQCLDPRERTGGGTVVFAVAVGEEGPE